MRDFLFKSFFKPTLSPRATYVNRALYDSSDRRILLSTHSLSGGHADIDVLRFRPSDDGLDAFWRETNASSFIVPFQDSGN